MVKNPPANVGDISDMGSIPGSGTSPGGGHGNPLQYSCLENPMDRGVWWATVHMVTELDMTSNLHSHTGFIFKENIYTGNKHYLPEELVSRPVKQFFYFLISVRKELPEGRLKKARVI